MEKEKISVIIGTSFPRKEWLNDAIGSIMNQTWQNWELLLYHDGNEDGCDQMLRQMAHADKRIRFFSGEKNRGLAHALNFCIAHAEGAYIARMDDDDYSEPRRLECQLCYLEEHPEIDWVGCEALLFDENGIWGKASRPERPEPEDYYKYSPFIHPSVLFRKAALSRAGGYLESRITARCEDYELFMRMAAQGMKGRNLPMELLRYREDAERIYQRAFRCYFYESLVRARGFMQLGCLNLKGIFFILKPLAVWGIAHFPRFAQRIRCNRDVSDHKIKVGS